MLDKINVTEAEKKNRACVLTRQYRCAILRLSFKDKPRRKALLLFLSFDAVFLRQCCWRIFRKRSFGACARKTKRRKEKNMKKIGKSLLSLLLVLVMLIQLMPMQAVHAWADGATKAGKEDQQAEAMSVPVGEDNSKREANIKQFRMSDGSWLAATYPAAVHFEEDGKWTEIDNRLEVLEAEKIFAQNDALSEVATEEILAHLWDKSGLIYQNTENRFGVMLPVRLNEQSWFGVTDSGRSLFFRMAGVQESESLVEKEPAEPEDPIQKAIQVHYISTVDYPSALPGAELKYEVRGQSLKETITFPELGLIPEQLSYEIWAEGMTAELAEDREIVFYAEGEPVFVFPSPFLMDSEGNSDSTLVVELEDQGDGRYFLRYMPNREWLESEERVWPVVLDPTITNVVNTNYIRDAYIRQGYPSYGGGLFPFFYAGFYSGATKAVRGLIKHTQIPSLDSGDVIVNATLALHGLVYQSNGTQIQVDAHAITGDWDSQTVKWNNQPAHENDVLDFQIVNSTVDDIYQWDVTRAVQRWYNGAASEKGTLPNQGFMLISPTESDSTILKAQFKSSDSSPSTNWPMLFIHYRNTSGLESYWDYTSASAGRAGTVSANNFTGNLVVSRSDVSYSGNRIPADISFTYNQNDCSTDIGYGKGWRSSYSQRIEQVNISGVTYYKWTDGDGTRIYFKYDSEKNEWFDENGLSYKLSVENGAYTITDRDENHLGFDGNGRLISLTDKLANSLSILYTESNSSNLRISRVTDGAGRVYDFNYSNNLLTSVVFKGAGSTAIETVSYTYDSGALTTVTYADGKTAGYSYISNKLTEARDIQRGDGSCNKLAVSYEGSPAKVTSIAYYDGATMVNSVSLLYGDHNTIVKDNRNRWCSYEFNNLGNTVSVYNNQGQALYGSFATNDGSSGRANQLTHSSRLQDTVVNLLNNRTQTGAWSETVTVQSGEMYSLSGVTAVGTTLSMSAGTETQTATSVSNTDRTEVTITIPANVTSLTISGGGNAWDLQLEQMEAASRYNLLVNTDMSDSTGWVGTNLGSNDSIVDVSGSRAKLNISALKLEGSGTSSKHYTQTISVSGSLGDDYSFGAWVKSKSVPLGNQNSPNSNQDRHCGIRVRLLNGSTEVDSKTIDANTDCQEWQFISGSVRASGAYDTVEFSFVYDYNANVSYFDGAQLFREKFAYVYHYDDEGRIDKITDLEGRETTYTYRGTTSDITSITLPGGSEYSYSYNNSGLLQSAVSDTGVTSAYTYDTYGNPTGTTITGGNEKNLTSGMTYSADGNMTASVTGNDANTVSYTNDTDRSLVMSVTDPAQSVTSNTYDTMRRPVSSQTGNSSITNSYSNDLLTGLSHTNTANTSTQYTLEYTTADLLSAVKVGSTYTLVQNSYDSDTWNLELQSYSNGDGWAYEYSPFDDLTARWTVKDGPGTEIRYFYNSEGALARVEQYTTIVASREVTSRTLLSTERYYYDTSDRLIRVWETDASNNEHEFRWTYDSNDQVTELVETVNGHSWTYANSYNGDQQPTQSSYGNVLESFTYDGLGRLSQTAVGNSGNNVLTTNYAFRDLDATRTTTQVAEVRNRYGLTDESITYTYDSRGNISSVTFPLPPPAPFLPLDPILWPTPTPSAGLTSTEEQTESDTFTIYYEYDALNELTWEKSELEEKAWKYTYDLGGNILSKTEYSYQNGVVGSTPLSTVNYTYGDANWPDLLTAYNGSPISYDGMGNPLSYRGWSFTWQGGRQLAAAEKGTTSLNFVYNESGLRTQKAVGSEVHRYVYRDSTLVAEITDDYELYFHHDARGEIVGFTYVSGNTEAEYFYRKNLQGDVIGILDASGNSVAEYAYDAWGQILEASGSMAEINPIRYRGYYFDRETGLYYLHSRYYDPEVGRFINADDAGTLGANGEILSYNLFAYCLNNPVNRTDDGGNLSWLGKIAVGLAVIAVVAVVSVATAGTGTVLACAAAGALEGAITGAATGAVTGAAIGAVSHRITTGSWEGAGRAALEGAADGFMTGAISGAVTGALTSPYCFVAGTLVQTVDGPKPIEEIQPGDWVWAWDEETGEVALRPVMETYVNETDELVHVFVSGEEIITTPGHPFYSPVKGWTDAVHLRAGDILVLVNGEYVVVEKIQHELLESPIHVYNFNVAGFHTYYVTNAGLLVHNGCQGNATKSNYRARAKEYYNTDAIGKEAHHVFPQKFEPQFSKAGINIHDPRNIVFLDKAVHQSGSYAYNKAWQAFFSDNPGASYKAIKIAGQFFMEMFS